jgi:basic amino acid/polyamine antiporter, APA family
VRIPHGQPACLQGAAQRNLVQPVFSNDVTTRTNAPRPLRRILGLGFGLAIVFGTMVGVGILRLPGTVAAALGDPTLVMVCWVIGGLYALMGAVSVSELAAMFPEAGGFRVYARRAFGEPAGFVIGWIDWLVGVAALAYGPVTVGTFLAQLWPALTPYVNAVGIGVLALFTLMNAWGLRAGSSLTSGISAATGLLMIVLLAACFVAPRATVVAATTVAPRSLFSIATLLAFVPAIRAILTAYDGWYAPIYMAEENTNAARSLPRAIIGGAMLVVAMYLLINLAFLRVLPIPVLAASSLPAADAARHVLPRGGAELVTLIASLTVLGFINSNLLTTPRILFAIARDGWIPERFAYVGRGGTPQAALAVTLLASTLMIYLSNRFSDLIDLFAVLLLLYYVASFLAVFVIRWRMPERARPYRAFGFPVTTLIVLLGSVLFLVAAVVENWRSGVTALVVILVCVPAYAWAERERRVRTGTFLPSPAN